MGPSVITYRGPIPPRSPGVRLRHMARRGPCFVAVQSGEWGVAAASLTVLAKRLRGATDVEGIWQVWYRRPDVIARRLPDA